MKQRRNHIHKFPRTFVLNLSYVFGIFILLPLALIAPLKSVAPVIGVLFPESIITPLPAEPLCHIKLH